MKEIERILSTERNRLFSPFNSDEKPFIELCDGIYDKIDAGEYIGDFINVAQLAYLYRKAEMERNEKVMHMVELYADRRAMAEIQLDNDRIDELASAVVEQAVKEMINHCRGGYEPETCYLYFWFISPDFKRFMPNTNPYKVMNVCKVRARYMDFLKMVKCSGRRCSHSKYCPHIDSRRWDIAEWYCEKKDYREKGWNI